MNETAPDRFGNWLQPSTPGLFGLQLPALVAAGVGALLSLIFLITGRYAAMGVVVLVTFLIITVGMIPFGGRTLLSRFSDSRSLARRRKAGETLYVTGAMSTLPPEVAERLPGALLDVHTITGTDGQNREYTLLHHREVGQIAAVFGCAPDGSAMQEQSVVNGQVSNFGGWLSALSVEDGLSGATIVVDSASESSAGMIQTMHDSVAPHAPEHAKRVLHEAAATLPARTSTVNVYATLVYDIAELGGARGEVDNAVAEIAARMPYQTAMLGAAGGGPVVPLVEPDLARVAQLAYQPTRDQELALDDLQGLGVNRAWENAGPGFIDDSHGRITFHDGVASMTVMMTAPPSAHITANSFSRLFGPDPKFLRKRVAILYRPVDPGTGAKTVDRQVKNAQWRMDTRRSRATSFDKAAKAVAEKTEEELAAGARLAMFSVMITVSFEPDEKAYRDAMNRLKSLMNQVMMNYRFVEHAGSAAFHTTLPFGVLPWRYSLKPLWMEGAV